MKTKRMIFLDRDGVINENPVYLDYIKTPAEFKFLKGVKKAIKMLNKAGFEVVVISNQSGIAKGLFTKGDLKAIDEKMFKGLKETGAVIKKTYYCTHLAEENCGCKKPDTGMLKKAVGKSRIDKKNSFFIGDTQRDAHAGNSYGVITIAVLSGYAGRGDIKKWKIKPDYIAKDLISAVEGIILKGA